MDQCQLPLSFTHYNINRKIIINHTSVNNLAGIEMNFEFFYDVHNNIVGTSNKEQK